MSAHITITCYQSSITLTFLTSLVAVYNSALVPTSRVESEHNIYTSYAMHFNKCCIHFSNDSAIIIIYSGLYVTV